MLLCPSRFGARLLVLLVVIPLLASCASTVRTRLNTFMAPDAEFGQGTVAVKAASDSSEDSLEFNLYRSKLENRLKTVGYSIAAAEEAQYIARLGYSVDEIDRSTQPNIVFTTGFGHYYRRGSFGLMFDDRPDYEPEYIRRITLTITRTPDELGGEPRRVYETTAISRGSCPIISVVFDEMLAAIFQDFPGDNGGVQTLRVRGDSECR